jgi:hypothetical protein
METMPGIIWLSLASALVSFTISEAKLFLPFRDYIRKRNTFLCQLFSCGYCLGHWVAFILEAIYRPNLFNSVPVLDHVLTAFVIAWLSGIQWAVMNVLMRIAGK